MKRMNHSKTGFTLVEMMVVVGLIGLLTLFALPAFQEANRGGRARTAIFQMSTALSLARQTAITTRQNVHILFPDRDVNYDQMTVDLAYRAYALYGERDGYIGEWRRMPDGVVFENEFGFTNESGPGIRNIFRQTGTYLKEVRFPDNTSITEEWMLALTFRPDGALHHAGFNPKAVYISEGWVELTDARSFDRLEFRPEATIFGLEIRPESGQARAREYNP